MIAMTWFGKSAKDADRKMNEAVSRVVKTREQVTQAKERLERVLDLTDSRMEMTLTKLVHVRRVPK